jgi:DNA repair photolyase
MSSAGLPILDGQPGQLPGCDVIYRPSGQAAEYAAIAVNPYRGCGHHCTYCYVPAMVRISPVEFHAGATPKKDFIARLKRDAEKCRAAGITEQVLLCFTTDPYHPGDTTLTRQTIAILREHGLGFCTLTKGGSRALRDLDFFRPERDAFATTLTSLDETVSQRWEPHAAPPEDRIAALSRPFTTRGFTPGSAWNRRLMPKPVWPSSRQRTSLWISTKSAG